MVVQTVFGVTAGDAGIEIKPFVTERLRRETFAGAGEIVLENLRLKGKQVAVRLHLPPATPGDGYYTVKRVTLNGHAALQTIAWNALLEQNQIDIELGALASGQHAIRRVSADPYTESSTVFGPREPAIASLARDAGAVRLDIAASGNGADVAYNVYRDGRLVAHGLPAGAWTDRSGGAAACYALEAQFAGSGNRSHHSVPRCVAPGIEVPATDSRVDAGVPMAAPDARFAQPHLAGWGKPGERFGVTGIRVGSAGRYAVQVRYHNSANQVNLGISGGVKWLAVKDRSGRIVAQGVIQLPHARIEKTNTPLVWSTPLFARLAAGTYSLQVSDFYNMSYLGSNSSFSGAGGVEGPSNRFDIYGVRLLRVR
jgi:hypothetical protein